MALLSRTFFKAEAREVAAWSYAPPFDLYNGNPDHPELFLTRTAAGEGYYPAVDQHGALVAFAVFGVEARVRGQEPAADTLDVGLGVRPDLTSLGIGTELLSFIVAQVSASQVTPTLRCAVAVFNARSLALCHRAGFLPVRDFTGPGERTFRELTRTLAASRFH
ncbi:ribosomal-protein-alanine N-acetyltransferase [Halopolyspora algeriensis]|uniref:Ribosomal-protein-alanine N-acetyltransferase n=1 Tax=Halopolyspora algeriensis TaxID=1500506 RepID=A0A368VIT6_9ACTN|nr:GNAT family N-acetyltransferase [Halopolyspora algeriensis]RCW40124.1 ribosomal-protein-alanine N-acetyltransferase [Halopolyspora algeriensis]TQM46392.1 ribosomal-protein-alanine N-acetyltransferase [Halopolyspora algeriensis]